MLEESEMMLVANNACEVDYRCGMSGYEQWRGAVGGGEAGVGLALGLIVVMWWIR